jgi:dTDP-4-amino-4,6-dideoxygalactose transaminase
MLVRKTIELERARMVRALLSIVFAEPDALTVRICASWTPKPALVTLSVRSGLDLYLSERAWTPGAEILMSGANVPDMARIIEHHGLRVRALDFELSDLGPSVSSFAAGITRKTRAILFAQLFGSRTELSALAALARERGIDLIEDAAQAFDVEYRGHPEADLALISFGPIKSVTALGGAVLAVRDPALAQSLRRRLASQPQASGAAFRRRLMKYLGLATLSRPGPLSLVAGIAQRRGDDLDAWLAGSARSFAGRDLLTAIRERPSRPLLALLAQRLDDLPVDELRERARQGADLAASLRDCVEVPGTGAASHAYWVFPVLCDNPKELVGCLRAAGFDATRRATLAPVAAELPQLERSFERLVYLPFAIDHSEQDRARMLRVIRTRARLGPVGRSRAC